MSDVIGLEQVVCLLCSDGDWFVGALVVCLFVCVFRWRLVCLFVVFRWRLVCGGSSCLFVCLCVQMETGLFVCVFRWRLVCLFVCSDGDWFVCLLCSDGDWFVGALVVCLFVCVFRWRLVCLFVCSDGDWFVCLCVQMETGLFVCCVQMETGLWGSLMIFSGMVGALLAGFLLDHTKLFKEVTVMSYSMAILCIIWFYEVRIRHSPAPASWSWPAGSVRLFSAVRVCYMAHTHTTLCVKLSARVADECHWSSARSGGF